MDALHGDIGNVSPGDIVVMLSKSGTTEELVTLVPYAKAKGGFIVAATNNPNSKLAQICDMHVTVPCNGELTPFNDGPCHTVRSFAHRLPVAIFSPFLLFFFPPLNALTSLSKKKETHSVHPAAAAATPWCHLTARGVQGPRRL